MPTLAGAVMCRTHGIPAEAGAESGVVVGQLRSNNDRGRYVQDVRYFDVRWTDRRGACTSMRPKPR